MDGRTDGRRDAGVQIRIANFQRGCNSIELGLAVARAGAWAEWMD